MLLSTTAVVAYSVFGMTGFGAAMVAVPILAQFMPLQSAVPLMLLMDLVSTSTVGLRNRASISWNEVMRISPFLLVGVLLGASILATQNSRWLLTVLGIFVIGVAVRALVAPQAATYKGHPFWVVPAGIVGGFFSALFGTGGPIYTLYLVQRLREPDAFRATIATVIFTSALTRLAAFGATGLLFDKGLMLRALFAVPFCLFGVVLGSRMRTKIAPEKMKKAVLWLLILSGCFVLLRGVTSTPATTQVTEAHGEASEFLYQFTDGQL